MLKGVKKNIDKAWYWEYLSANPAISWEFIRDNDYPWTDNVNMNPNITFDIVKQNPDFKLFNPIIISKNPNITVDIVKNNMDYSWDWWNLTCNDSITFDDIHKYSSWPWNFYSLNLNRNITPNIIMNNQWFPWNISALINNKMDSPSIYNNILYLKYRQNKTKEYLDIIRKELIQVTWHPDRIVDWCGLHFTYY